jgi:hypothetical protein
VKIPADPPKEEREPKLVAPVTFLNERNHPEPPPGIVHPSQNRSHIMVFDSDQGIEFAKAADDEVEEEPTESDLDPLLIEQDPNALKGGVLEP